MGLIGSSNLNNDSVIDCGDYIVIKAYHPEPFPIERPPQKDGYHYDAVHGEFVPIEEWKERFFEIRIPKKEWEESEKRLMRKIEWMKKNGKFTLPERMRKLEKRDTKKEG